MDTLMNDALDVPIACSLTAEEQTERGDSFQRLFSTAEAVSELPNGYRLQFSNEHEWIRRAVELIIAERECCPFFRFSLEFEPGGGSVWLEVTGPDDVKEAFVEGWIPDVYRWARSQ